MPRHHVQRAVTDAGFVELAAPFDGDLGRHLAVLIRRHRGLEVARIGHAVGTNRATARKLELLAIVFADKAARRTFQHLDPVNQPARQDGNFLRGQVDHAQLGAKPQAAFLRDHQKFAVGGIEILIHHRLGDKIDMRGHADLRVHIPRRRHGPHSGQPCRIARLRHRVPAVLPKADHIGVHMRGRLPIRQVDLGKAPGVLDRRADAVAPRPFVLMAGRGKGGARQLLAIKAIVALLRGVLALRQRTRQRLGFKVIAEAGHVARRRARGQTRRDQGKLSGHFGLASVWLHL